MNKVTLISRYLLGIIFFVFGLNYFLHFIPLPPMSGNSGAFMGLLFTSGYLAVVKVIEILGGLSLLIGRTTLGLVLLLPILVNIILFDVLLSRAFNPLSTVATLCALVLISANRERFAALLK